MHFCLCNAFGPSILRAGICTSASGHPGADVHLLAGPAGALVPTSTPPPHCFLLSSLRCVLQLCAQWPWSLDWVLAGAGSVGAQPRRTWPAVCWEGLSACPDPGKATREPRGAFIQSERVVPIWGARSRCPPSAAPGVCVAIPGAVARSALALRCAMCTGARCSALLCLGCCGWGPRCCHRTPGCAPCPAQRPGWMQLLLQRAALDGRSSPSFFSLRRQTLCCFPCVVCEQLLPVQSACGADAQLPWWVRAVRPPCWEGALWQLLQSVHRAAPSAALGVPQPCNAAVL